MTSLLKVGDAIHVRDLSVPSSVKILDDADDLVVRVTRLAAEEVAVVPGATATAVAEPEVIKKGKTDEEEEEGAAAAKPAGKK